MKLRSVLFANLLSCPFFVSAETPRYTNEDLARVSPLRGETGVENRPVVIPSASSLTSSTPSSEAHWRREASRVRDRVRIWQEQCSELEARIAAERAVRESTKKRTSPIPGLERRRDLLRERIRREVDQLEERARRAGALPGWVRMP